MESIFLLPLLLLATISVSASDSVLDLDGRPLLTSSAYYILPVIRGDGGGLALGRNTKSNPCPSYVIQSNREVSRGLPVKFHPVNSSADSVTLSTDMNVESIAFTVCVQSGVWQLSGVEGPIDKQKRYVKALGVTGNPGLKTISNWFKIEEDEATKGKFYKLVFCPNVCNFCKVVCGDIGVYREDGRRLGLAPALEPLHVVFKKA